jgi:hypothetical protein
VIVLSLGIFICLVGLAFMWSCFTRVDSPKILARASGNEEKVANLQSIQASWDKLGKIRRFVSSSLSFFIIGVGLLLFWYDKSVSKYYLVVPILYAVLFLFLLSINKYAKSVLTTSSFGDLQILQVIKLNMRICLTFSIVFIVLVLKT